MEGEVRLTVAVVEVDASVVEVRFPGVVVVVVF